MTIAADRNVRAPLGIAEGWAGFRDGNQALNGL